MSTSTVSRRRGATEGVCHARAFGNASRGGPIGGRDAFGGAERGGAFDSARGGAFESARGGLDGAFGGFDGIFAAGVFADGAFEGVRGGLGGGFADGLIDDHATAVVRGVSSARVGVVVGGVGVVRTASMDDTLM